ncbi:hypothetical protein [uncultured Bacteroides sp.]|uniref:hypothetical protein n=1 Tax=uncultured Bacteroides sp. TaxID=162156 RepID=UPI0025999C51|nr:hypothetical protein [uncultured Bacteroides sp.]
MSCFEIIINCLTALGALATAGTFIYVIKSQKGTQKQIDSLSQMATTFARQYEMARIQAGNTIYPKIQLTLKHDAMWGMKIAVKNLSYPVEIYRIIVNTGQHHSDITIKPKDNYIVIRQGETKAVLPGEMVRHPLYIYSASIRLFMVTPFDEAYEVRYAVSNEQETYQSEAIPILYREEDHENGIEPTITAKEYSIHGNIPGTVEDNFPEISRDSDNV